MEELDEIIRLGEISVAALVKRSLYCDFSNTVSIHGAKRPIAVLVRCNDVTMAFEINGSRIAQNDLERRFPGQCAEFEKGSGDY